CIVCNVTYWVGGHGHGHGHGSERGTGHSRYPGIEKVTVISIPSSHHPLFPSFTHFSVLGKKMTSTTAVTPPTPPATAAIVTADTVSIQTSDVKIPTSSALKVRDELAAGFRRVFGADAVKTHTVIRDEMLDFT